MGTLEVYRGDDKNYLLHFVDGAGADINITDWTVFFTVKPHPISSYDADDTGALISKTITVHTVPLEGKTTISLSKTEFASLPISAHLYDIQVKRADGTIKTIVVGTFNVLRDITRRTS